MKAEAFTGAAQRVNNNQYAMEYKALISAAVFNQYTVNMA